MFESVTESSKKYNAAICLNETKYLLIPSISKVKHDRLSCIDDLLIIHVSEEKWNVLKRHNKDDHYDNKE